MNRADAFDKCIKMLRDDTPWADVNLAKENISKPTAKAIRQYLLHKVREYPQSEVREVTEEYTSKTCGQCGLLHQKLGSNKEFHCPYCSFSMPRDWNGARNIALKYMTEHPQEFKIVKNKQISTSVDDLSATSVKL